MCLFYKIFTKYGGKIIIKVKQTKYLYTLDHNTGQYISYFCVISDNNNCYSEDNGGHTLSTIVDKLSSYGYEVSWEVLNASDFGVPQNRERIIIIASKRGKFDFSAVGKHPKVRMVEFLDKSGNFEYLDKDTYTLLENPKIQNSGLIFAGYRNKSIRKTGIRPGTENLSRVHKQPNRIYSIYGVHPTLSSQETSGRYFVLTEDKHVRKLTLNECWRLMGFPDTYKKISPITEQYKQLGNSVCIPMISELAQEIKKQLFN